jgi:hypothetical protein
MWCQSVRVVVPTSLYPIIQPSSHAGAVQEVTEFLDSPERAAEKKVIFVSKRRDTRTVGST